MASTFHVKTKISWNLKSNYNFRIMEIRLSKYPIFHPRILSKYYNKSKMHLKWLFLHPYSWISYFNTRIKLGLSKNEQSNTKCFHGTNLKTIWICQIFCGKILLQQRIKCGKSDHIKSGLTHFLPLNFLIWETCWSYYCSFSLVEWFALSGDNSAQLNP